jgi:glutamine synthetase
MFTTAREGLDSESAGLSGAGPSVVRLLFADLHGVARGKDIPRAVFAAASDFAFCAAVLTTDLRQTPVVASDEAFGDLLACPDLETLHPLPWLPEVAWCMADLREVSTGKPHSGCARSLVARLVGEYAELGLAPIVGSELEFFLLEDRGADTGSYRRYVDGSSRSYSVGHLVDPEGVLFEILTACEALGLRPQAANHEFSNSQYEISLGHSNALDAADRAFRLKTAVKELAGRRKLVATFMGKPFNDQGGTGLHLHLSLTDLGGRNVFEDPRPGGLSERATGFLAGILDHAPGLTALLAPTVNAYKRLVPESLAPVEANWGLDNRTTFIRIPPERGAGTRIEVRAADGSANSYLAVSALLAAGLDGIRRELKPPDPVGRSSYVAGSSGARSGAVLPRNLGSALDRLERDDVLVAALGDELVRMFVRLKRAEVERFDSWVTDWELEEYARHL